MPCEMSRPRVLAFIHDWSPPQLEPRIRAELRGLGAELVVVAAGAAWSMGPDDELAPVHEIAALDHPAGDAVFVLDGDGAVRFSHHGAVPSLGDALAAAGEAMRTRAPVTFTRREWAVASLCAGFALCLFGCGGRQPQEPAPAPKPHPDPAPDPPGPSEYDIVLAVNGRDRSLRVDARVTLLDALRERLGRTGTKKGCDHGQCGACTVHVDGRRINSCMQLAIMSQGQRITTIEGLATGAGLHPMQAAFIEHDGFQCGYCTPGQIMSAVAMLAEGRATTDDEVREAMSGNLCRCGAYPNIIAAIAAARRGA